jgi:hypothetical protein
MKKTSRKRFYLSLMAAASAVTLGAAPALADPAYSFLTTIAVPPSADNSISGNFATYDISSFDPTTQLNYVGDRSNAAVDIFSAATDSYVGRIGGSNHVFSGQLPSNDASGPDGVLAVNSGGLHEVFVGNGDSTLKVFTPQPQSGAAPVATIATGPASNNRVDELAFDPNTKQILAANDAATPYPYLNLINTTNNTIAKQIVLNGNGGTPRATGGIEQPVYDPLTNHYYVSIPQINGAGPGGVTEFDSSGNVTHIFDFANISGASISACGPTGLAVSSGGTLAVNCGNVSQTILLNPSALSGAGSIKTVKQVSGGDQVAYDPANNLFFVTGASNPGGPIVGIINASTDAFVQALTTTPGDHSVAVDPITGQAFVPFGSAAGNTVCAAGCIAVFAPIGTSVPEPGSLALLLTGLAGVAGVVKHRRRPV